MARAEKGGQTGMNGEWYEGGQFLPNTQLHKMTKSQKPHKAHKQEVEPYRWEEVPEGMASIYTNFAGLFGKIINGTMVVNCNEQTIAYYGKTLDEVEAMAQAYNSGERWMAK